LDKYFTAIKIGVIYERPSNVLAQNMMALDIPNPIVFVEYSI
jgi:hypothetical protein